MTKTPSEKEKETGLGARLQAPIHRRGFLLFAGAATAGTALLLSGCKDDDDDTPDPVDPNADPHPNDPNASGAVLFTNDDFGVLNYAYALEQLEAAFYTQVITSQFSGITAEETLRLTEIRDHEIGHREFLKAAIPALGGTAIGALTVDFSSIDFGNRNSVLGTAKAFEDLGVSAYNGAGKLLVSSDLLLFAGKIVSVEARHAAYIRDLISPGSFAGDDVVSATTGFDLARTPADVLTIAGKYIKTNYKNNLPTS